MRALQVNFTTLGIYLRSTELLRWKNQKRSTRYPMTLQKRDSIADIFPRAPPSLPTAIFSGISHKQKVQKQTT